MSPKAVTNESKNACVDGELLLFAVRALAFNF
jgi:hypothetical protein